jgi:hypothetical protein
MIARKDGKLVANPIGATITAETLVGFNASGLLCTLATAALFAGFAIEGGTVGEVARTETTGAYELTFGAAITQAAVGKAVFATAAGVLSTTSAAGSFKVGILESVTGSNIGFVRIDGTFGNAAV